jgi:WXG100 family type VII secretion target
MGLCVPFVDAPVGGGLIRTGGALALTVFNTQTPEMQAAAKKAKDSGSDIASGLSRLLRELEALPGGFKGAAAVEFGKAQETMRQSLTDIVDALNDVAEGIQTAGRDFDASDQESAQEVQKAVANLLRG